MAIVKLSGRRCGALVYILIPEEEIKIISAANGTEYKVDDIEHLTSLDFDEWLEDEKD